jgi:hypothetical protein
MNDIIVTAQQRIKVDRISSVTEEAENAAMIMSIWLEACRHEYMTAYELESVLIIREARIRRDKCVPQQGRERGHSTTSA